RCARRGASSPLEQLGLQFGDRTERIKGAGGLDPRGVPANPVAVIADVAEPAVAPISAPRILDQPGILRIAPTDDRHGVAAAVVDVLLGAVERAVVADAIARLIGAERRERPAVAADLVLHRRDLAGRAPAERTVCCLAGESEDKDIRDGPPQTRIPQ